MNIGRWFLALALASSIASGNPLAAEEPDDGPTAETFETLRAERSLQREALRARMLDEGRDPDWASELEAELRASLLTVDGLARPQSVECFRTLCEVVLSHSSAADQEAALTKLAGSPGFDLAGLAHLENGLEEAPVMTYVYLASEEGEAYLLNQ